MRSILLAYVFSLPRPIVRPLRLLLVFLFLLAPKGGCAARPKCCGSIHRCLARRFGPARFESWTWPVRARKKSENYRLVGVSTADFSDLCFFLRRLPLLALTALAMFPKLAFEMQTRRAFRASGFRFLRFLVPSVGHN